MRAILNPIQETKFKDLFSVASLDIRLAVRCVQQDGSVIVAEVG